MSGSAWSVFVLKCWLLPISLEVVVPCEIPGPLDPRVELWNGFFLDLLQDLRHIALKGPIRVLVMVNLGDAVQTIRFVGVKPRSIVDVLIWVHVVVPVG